MMFHSSSLIGGPHRTVQPFSDEDASIETMSHCSGYSDPSSFAEDGRSVQWKLWDAKVVEVGGS